MSQRIEARPASTPKPHATGATMKHANSVGAAVVALEAMPGVKVIPGPIGWAATAAAAFYMLKTAENAPRPQIGELPFVKGVFSDAVNRFYGQMARSGGGFDRGAVAREFRGYQLLWQDRMIRTGVYGTADASAGSNALFAEVLNKAQAHAAVLYKAQAIIQRPPATRRSCIVKNSRKQAEEAAKLYSRLNGGPGTADLEYGRCGSADRWHFDPLGPRGEHIGPHFWFSMR